MRGHIRIPEALAPYHILPIHHGDAETFDVLLGLQAPDERIHMLSQSTIVFAQYRVCGGLWGWEQGRACCCECRKHEDARESEGTTA